MFYGFKHANLIVFFESSPFGAINCEQKVKSAPSVVYKPLSRAPFFRIRLDKI